MRGYAMCAPCVTARSESRDPFRRPHSGALPPDSFGGRALLLTCKECNNISGMSLDAHARRRENIFAARKGQLKEELRVLFHYAARKISARLVASTKGTYLRVVPKANHPAVITELQSTGIPPQT